MKYLSLFSGIEACTVAWKPLGWECAAVAEIEPFPCAVLAHHYPNVPNLGDVTKITEEDIKNLGQIDLVVFGSPCQNLSVAGNRKGLQGESSGLFYEAIRLISYARKHCGTRFALWENVPGSFSSNKGDDFREVVRELSANRDINTPENGWGNTGVALGENGLVEWRVLDAQYFGLAQRRKRVFAIVDFGNWMDRPPILLEPKSLCGDTPPSRETGQSIATDTQISTVREGSFGTFVDSETAGTTKASGGVLGGGSESLVVVHGTQDPITSETTANCLGRNNGQENVVFFETRYDDEVVRLTKDDLSPTLTAGMGMAGTNHINTAYQVVSIAGNTIGRSPQNGGNGNGFDEEVCYTPTTADRHALAFQTSYNNLSVKHEISQPILAAQGTTGNKGVNVCYIPTTADRRLVAFGVSGQDLGHCLRSNPSKAYKPSSTTYVMDKPTSIIRRLTPMECEILQGFPRNYTKIPYRKKPADQCPDSPRYKALGNSMAVPVMRWIGEKVQKAVTA